MGGSSREKKGCEEFNLVCLPKSDTKSPPNRNRHIWGAGGEREKESKEGLGCVCAWIFFIAITNVQDERTARKRKSPSRVTNSSQDTEWSEPQPCPTVGLHDPSFSDVLLFKNFLQNLNMKTIKVVDYGGKDESGGSFSSNTELDYSKESSIILTVVLSVPQIFLPRLLLRF